jgi:hypothetical protein
MTRPHSLHGNSIPKIGQSYFWPEQIALPKNTLPINYISYMQDHNNYHK